MALEHDDMGGLAKSEGFMLIRIGPAESPDYMGEDKSSNDCRKISVCRADRRLRQARPG